MTQHNNNNNMCPRCRRANPTEKWFRSTTEDHKQVCEACWTSERKSLKSRDKWVEQPSIDLGEMINEARKAQSRDMRDLQGSRRGAPQGLHQECRDHQKDGESDASRIDSEVREIRSDQRNSDQELSDGRSRISHAGREAIRLAGKVQRHGRSKSSSHGKGRSPHPPQPELSRFIDWDSPVIGDSSRVVHGAIESGKKPTNGSLHDGRLPIRRAAGTQLIYKRILEVGGTVHIDERSANLHPWSEQTIYAGHKRENTARFMIKTFTNKGDAVLDPFCGAGAFPFMAKLLDRIPYASDILLVPTIATAALITSPEREVLKFLLLTIVKRSRELKNSILEENYPPALRSWFTHNMFVSSMAIREVIMDLKRELDHSSQMPQLYKYDMRCINFLLTHLSHLLTRIGFNRGGFHWRLDLKSYKSRQAWNCDPITLFEELVNRSIRVQDPKLWDTSFEVKIADARKLPYPDGFFPRIVTDPPYGDMIKYLVQVWPQEWYLGDEDICSMEHDVKISAVPDGVQRKGHKLIQSMHSFWQDMELAITEFYRVLQSDGTLTIIMGDFTVRNKIYNPAKDLERIFRKIGFDDVVTIDKPFDRPHKLHHVVARKETSWERIIVGRKPCYADDIIEDKVIELDDDEKGLFRFFKRLKRNANS